MTWLKTLNLKEILNVFSDVADTDTDIDTDTDTDILFISVSVILRHRYIVIGHFHRYLLTDIYIYKIYKNPILFYINLHFLY